MARRRKKRLAAFAEPAHVATLYVGQSKPDGGRVTRAELQRIVDGTARGIGGGATRLIGHGVWLEPGKPDLREDVATIGLVGSAADSCSKFMDRARALAGRAAGISKQTAVLTVVQCADGSIDADLVNARGQTEYPLTRLPGQLRRVAEYRRKR
jgi:hypothetical protein